MGYAAERKREQRIHKAIKRWIFVFVALLLGALGVLNSFYPCASWKYYFAKPKLTALADGEMRIHFLDVGQGDATFIELPDGKTALIDGGNGAEENNLSMLRYLNALKVKKIDYLVATHADFDHCGGLVEVVRYKEIGRAFLPVVDESVGDAYAEFYSELVEKECAVEYAKRSVSLSTDTYSFQFLYPLTFDVDSGAVEEDTNASSAVFWLDYQGVSALFTGDAPTAVEERLIKDDNKGYLEASGVALSSTEILKVAHHGSKDSTSEEFLRHLGVQTAVVSCGKHNLYGHPSDEVLQRLSAVGADTYRTDELGHITITVKRDGSYAVANLQNK